MNMKLIFRFSAIAAVIIGSPSNAFAQEKLEIDGFCQYAGEPLPQDLYGFESDAEAQAAVKRVLDYTGLAQNFIIKAANVDNAAAVIQGQQRLILYNQDFMKQVRKTTNTDWAAVSIMAHEIGHHLQGHTIQSGGSRPTIELEADKYSGYVLYRMGATLAQAKAAMLALGSEQGSTTHPPRSARLAAISNGWLAAEALAKNPPKSGEPNSIPEPQSPSGPPINPGPMPVPSTVQYVARVVFSGDPILYFVTASDDIIGLAQGNPNPIIVGKKIPATLPGFAWMYSTPQITYGVTPAGQVLSKNAFGQVFQVGYVTGPS